MKDRILRWWYFSVLNRVVARREYGGFEVEFRRFDVRIRTLGGNFCLKLRATERAFGYLAASLSSGKEDNVHGFAAYMYFIAEMLCTDPKFHEDIHKAVKRCDERVQKSAEVPEGNGEEEITLEKVESMSRRERRKLYREMKKVLKEDADKGTDSSKAE